MSRIGNNPITIPEGVTIEVQPTQVVVKGKLGELTQEYSDVEIKIEENTLTVSRPSDKKSVKSKHGLYRALIANMVEGVSHGFTKELELVGVGYRASNQGQKLDLALAISYLITMRNCCCYCCYSNRWIIFNATYWNCLIVYISRSKCCCCWSKSSWIKCCCCNIT